MAEFLNHEIWVSSGGRDGKGRGSVKARPVTVLKLASVLSRPSQDNSITYTGYMKLSVDEKGARKAAPGFILAGKFRDGKRKMSHFEGKSAVQIDIDNCTPDQWAYIRDGQARINDFGYIWHTTRAHCPEKPRVRVLVPTDRLMNADEANAITRLLSLYLAEDPDEAIEIPDSVSHKVNQIMYLPSISREQEFKHGINDAALFKVDAFLAEHPDWTDVSKLPRKDSEKSAAGPSKTGKMEDPREKPGLIGAFCRAYDVREAIEEFLPDIYAPGESTDYEERYTYLLGSAANGAVVYDDGLFLTSHHSSDPAEGTHNAWDLVRLHLFGEKDDAAPANTTPGNMPSFKEMVALALKDPEVAKERTAAFVHDIDDEFDDYEDEEEVSIAELLRTDDEQSNADLLSMVETDDDPPPRRKKGKVEEARWQDRLVLDKDGNVEKCRYNVALIVCYDQRIARTIALNDLTKTPYIRAPLRFKEVPEAHQAAIFDKTVGREWTDADTAALNICLSAPRDPAKGYGRDFSTQDLEAAMVLAAARNRFNPFLESVCLTKWDGVRRNGTIWIEFLGAPDTPYVRELEYLFMLATITRVHEPGHPFHLVPIFGGKQGGGKSGFIKALALRPTFYSELSGDFSNPQKMVESVGGAVICELPELKGVHRSDMRDIKAYFTQEKATLRMAYRRNAETHMRVHTTIGTTNEHEYLRDEENRRFCPVPVTVNKDNVVDFARLAPLVSQLWAEIEHDYQERRRKQPKGHLDLTWQTDAARQEAAERQAQARETAIHEPVAEVIQAWLEKPYSAAAVAAMTAGNTGGADVDDFDGDDGEQMFVRNLVTATMIREKMAANPIIRDLKMAPNKVIGQALTSLEGWRKLGKFRRTSGGRSVQANWYARVGTDDQAEFVPREPSSDDLLR
jgi:predicted P-loop ATPase